jgi:DNA-binding MarR family transcriptional regulator
VVRVLRLGALLGTVGDALAKPAGQTSARWQVLAAIEREPATVANVARLLGLARQSVQRVADVLEKDGLAAYDENPLDLRADLLRLTARGRSALSAIQEAQRAWADDLGARIGQGRLQNATELLDRVTAELGKSYSSRDSEK